MNRQYPPFVLLVTVVFVSTSGLWACCNPPVCGFKVNQFFVGLGDRASFDASYPQSQDPDGGAIDYLWSFGSGATDILGSSGCYPSCKYTTPGYKTVSLRVRDHDSTDCIPCEFNCVDHLSALVEKWVIVSSVVKITKSNSTDEGPLYTCVGVPVSLFADPEGNPYPPNKPVWSVVSQPQGGAAAINPPQGCATVTVDNLTVPGVYTIKAKCGADDPGDTISITVIGIASFLPDQGVEFDDGDNDPDTRAYALCVESSGIVTVTATPTPTVPESLLPYWWGLGGGNGTSKLVRTVSKTTPSLTVISCNCGSDFKIASIYVTQISGIVASNPDNSTPVANTTITVLRGNQFEFRAALFPEIDPWPTNLFTWSGAAQGHDPAVIIPFNSAGTFSLTANFNQCDTKFVNIQVIQPVPDEVSFLGINPNEEHAIENVDDPVWKRVNNPNNPASYTKNKKIKVSGAFWSSGPSLTSPTPVIVCVGSGYFSDQAVIFQHWPSPSSSHISSGFLADTIGVGSGYLDWKYKVPNGTNTWIEMGNTGPHKLYRVFDAPKCDQMYYSEYNLSRAVPMGEGMSTEAAIATKANKSVYNGLHDGCICGEGFQVNFDAAMGTLPAGDKGMCCCRAEGLNCVLQVLGIGPYTHDFANEKPEPNYGRDFPQGYCPYCLTSFVRLYWTDWWNKWEGIVKVGGNGSIGYAPGGVANRDEGSYVQFRDTIAQEIGFEWVDEDTLTLTCPHLLPP